MSTYCFEIVHSVDCAARMGNWSSPHGFIVEVDDHRNWNLPATLFVNDDERLEMFNRNVIAMKNESGVVHTPKGIPGVLL